MNDDALNRLEQRIAKLEAANRRWSRLAACSAIFLTCIGLMAAQSNNVIEADRIEAQRILAKDAEGFDLITLRRIDNYPGMRLQFPASRASATFFTSADHATLALMDQNGASSIILNSGTAQSPPDLSMVRVGRIG
jgi:hypothetical protein